MLVIVRVWNEAVAHRLATLGHSARQGDLVWKQEGQNKLEDRGESSTPKVNVGQENIKPKVTFFLFYSLMQQTECS